MRLSRDRDSLSVQVKGLGIFHGGFGDSSHRRDQSELFVEDSTGNAAEKVREIAVVVPFGNRSSLENGVKILL